ncbi:MAG: S1/P1 nuclease [Pyrinomonadaceae bacterium]
MFKFSKRAVFSASAILLFAFPAFGWDDTGHKITAYVAWMTMTPAARERVFKILLEAPEDSDIATFYLSYNSRSEESRRREYFMLMASWADIVRDKKIEARYAKYHKSNWHYYDTFWMWKDGKAVVEDKREEGGVALPKLIEFDLLIRGTAPDAEKAVAIAWMEHLIGDLHQPLHTSARVTTSNPKGDQGGNLFLLTPKGTKRDQQLNLHSFWDGIIGKNMPNDKDLCEADYLNPIADDIMRQYPLAKYQDKLQMGSMDTWQKESFEIATREVYRDVKWFELPSDKYRKKALKISEERMALAGYRMGALFNQVFGAALPVK